jgi:putative colanic acid biosynthesis UDP-glucose lipid carrier transferase
MLPRALFSDSFRTSSFGTKLIDVFILTSCLILAAYIYGITFSREYLIVLVVLVTYSYIAEGLNLYRSWRAGKLRGMVLTAWFSLVPSFSGLFIFFFFLKYQNNFHVLPLCCGLLSLLPCYFYGVWPYAITK